METAVRKKIEKLLIAMYNKHHYATATAIKETFDGCSSEESLNIFWEEIKPMYKDYFPEEGDGT